MCTDIFIGYGYQLSADDVRRLFADEHGNICDVDNLWQINNERWFYGERIHEISKYSSIISFNRALDKAIAESGELSKSMERILNNIPMEDIATRWSVPDIFVVSRFVD